MSNVTSRKYMKTKYEGVFYRLSAKRDPRTGEPDRIYAFWYADAVGKGHWKTVGKHSQGIRAANARTARVKFLAEIANTGISPEVNENVTVGQLVDAYYAWGKARARTSSMTTSVIWRISNPRFTVYPLPLSRSTSFPS